MNYAITALIYDYFVDKQPTFIAFTRMPGRYFCKRFRDELDAAQLLWLKSGFIYNILRARYVFGRYTRANYFQ